MKRILLLSLIAMILPSFAAAQTAEEKGLALGNKMAASNAGWGSYTVEVVSKTTDARGTSATSDFKMYILERSNDGVQKRIVFDGPVSVKGTGLQFNEHPNAANEMWIYLPKIRRVKRFKNSDMSSFFMGSQFSLEDMFTFQPPHYTYQYQSDETIDGRQAKLVEFRPVDINSGYARMKVWIDASLFVPLKIEYYERSNALMKTRVFSDYLKHQDKYWSAGKQVMTNHKTGSSSVFTFSNFQPNAGLKSKDFTRNTLKGGR